MEAPEEMTLEKVAAMMAHGFEQTVTKADLSTLKEELNGNLEGLRADMNAGFETISKERNYGAEIDELRTSVTHIKKHLGIETK